MSFKQKDNIQVELKYLWGEFVPSLTSEQVDLAIKVWHKIKSRKHGLPEIEAFKQPPDS